MARREWRELGLDPLFDLVYGEMQTMWAVFHADRGRNRAPEQNAALNARARDYMAIDPAARTIRQGFLLDVRVSELQHATRETLTPEEAALLDAYDDDLWIRRVRPRTPAKRDRRALMGP